jgi:hypothetical protein
VRQAAKAAGVDTGRLIGGMVLDGRMRVVGVRGPGAPEESGADSRGHQQHGPDPGTTLPDSGGVIFRALLEPCPESQCVDVPRVSHERPVSNPI